MATMQQGVPVAQNLNLTPEQQKGFAFIQQNVGRILNGGMTSTSRELETALVQALAIPPEQRAHLNVSINKGGNDFTISVNYQIPGTFMMTPKGQIRYDGKILTFSSATQKS